MNHEQAEIARGPARWQQQCECGAIMTFGALVSQRFRCPKWTPETAYDHDDYEADKAQIADRLRLLP